MNEIEHQSVFSFSIDGVEPTPMVLAFEGREAVSQPFSLSVDIAVAIDDEGTAPTYPQWLYRSAVLTVSRGEGLPRRHIHGLVTAVSLLDQGRRHWHLRLRLEPLLALLRHRRHYRIFQDQSPAEIIRAVLDQLAPLRNHWRMDLRTSRAPLACCVQYDETDLDFVHRLLARAGMIYYFRHQSDAHELVIADVADIAGSLAPDTLNYAPHKGPMAAGAPVIWSFHHHQVVAVQQVGMRDYDYEHPDRELQAGAVLDPQRFGALQQSHYPGGFHDPHEGERLAGVFAAADLSARHDVAGGSNCHFMVPGFCFSVAGHPAADMNSPWLIAELQHSGRQHQVLEADADGRAMEYRNRFRCVPVTTLLPPSMPTRPRIHGVQTAVVAGPEPGRVHTDELGRIRLHFHWRGHGQDAVDSSWVRVGQISAGDGWGAGFIPRVGQEVVVEFENGNPDRPLVTGVVYNGKNRPRHFLPESATRSVIRSAFFQQGDKFSELVFEDGGEQSYLGLYSDGELRSHSDGDRLISTNALYQRHVRGDFLSQVDGDSHLTLLGSRRERILGDSWLQVEGDRTGYCEGSISNACDEDYSLQAAGKIILDARTALTISCGDSFIRLSAEGLAISGKVVNINSGGEADQVQAADMETPLPPQQAAAATNDGDGLRELVQDLGEIPGPAARILQQSSLDHSAFIDKCESQ